MSQKWIKKYVLITIFILSFIDLINYIMDPFWTFNHSHKFNNFQKGINERQQKSNYIYFTDKKYDTLLLGSSRTTYMNPNSFENYKVFNYSAVETSIILPANSSLEISGSIPLILNKVQISKGI